MTYDLGCVFLPTVSSKTLPPGVTTPALVRTHSGRIRFHGPGEDFNILANMKTQKLPISEAIPHTKTCFATNMIQCKWENETLRCSFIITVKLF